MKKFYKIKRKEKNYGNKKNIFTKNFTFYD